MRVRWSIARWVIGGLGVFALVMGVLGLVDPDSQAHMMGFTVASTRAQRDYTGTLLTITSLAIVNTALMTASTARFCMREPRHGATLNRRSIRAPFSDTHLRTRVMHAGLSSLK